MSKFSLVFSFVLCSLMAQAQVFVPVFTSGTDGYKSYRIPAIVGLKDGTLLAFSEGRVDNSADFGNIDIVLKRSTDKGKTWSALSVVADAGSLQAGNPAPVVDMTDPMYPQGRIFLFYNTGNQPEGQILRGKGVKRCWYKTSIDGGKTWLAPVDITAQVHLAYQPSIDSLLNRSADWRYYAMTPGHAMQMSKGKFRGRIFVASNHSYGAPQKRAAHYLAHGFYTDDHGKTFHLGASVNYGGSNESMAVELADGRLMMNSRNQAGDVRARIVSVSSNAGQTWDSTYFDHTLIDPVCQASILSISQTKGKQVLAFCNAADSVQRNNLTLRISKDDGKTWPISVPVYKGSGAKNFDYAAYSDLVQLSAKTIGVLFEKDDYAQIVFCNINWKKRK